VLAVRRDATSYDARGRQYDPDLALRHRRRDSRGLESETAAPLQSGSRKLRRTPVIQRVMQP
jgi:hypothetical protein